MLAMSATAGLQSVGCDVVDLGVVPTPTLLLAVQDAGSRRGIGVTASHNPGEWNALKFASAEGTFLDAGAMADFQGSCWARICPEHPGRRSGPCAPTPVLWTGTLRGS
jgi:phosphomannomutase